jgi:hypothetical protein
MNDVWENDDEVITTYRTINLIQKEFYDAGFAAGVAWAKENVK